jgi:hypothetical protein
MGGSGSGGRNYKGRPTVRSCYRLTVAGLKRNGSLRKGSWRLWTWERLVVTFETKWDDMIVMTWTSPITGSASEQFLGFQWLSHRRNFGGYQYYLVCPFCSRKCTAVYYFSDQFACRKCHRLPYPSQRETEVWRLRRKLEMLAQRLGSDFEWGSQSVPPRPKGMHIRTYQGIAQVYETSAVRMYLLEGMTLRRLLGRCP